MDKVVITCEELRELVGSPKVVILDASWDKEGKINYADVHKQEHIPGSFFFDFRNGVCPNEYLPCDLPNARTFETYVQSFGINNDTQVVLYEVPSDAGGFLAAGRSWWQFQYFGHSNVRVLEGGMERWKKLGFPVTAEATPSPIAGNFTANERKNKRVNYDEVKKLVSGGAAEGVQFVDSRPPPIFEKGHLPSSNNVPLGSFIKRDTLKLPSADEIAAAFKNRGVDVSKPVVTYCNQGNSSAGLACIAAAAGLDWRVYVGSWNEWSKRQQEESK